MKKSDFYYELPPELIAQHPLPDRDGSRLLVVDRQKANYEDRHFFELGDLLRPGDLLVANNSRVIPARLLGRKETGAKAEILLLKDLGDDRWETIVKPGRRLTAGDVVLLDSDVTATIEQVLPDGNRIVAFTYDHACSFPEILDRIGAMPLPPYITEKLEDKERYQTVYAKLDGSAAAPTAGLHFTPELIEKLAQKGIGFAELTLHVGLGTFRPVKEEDITDHQMHSEWYTLDEKTAVRINEVRRSGGRIIAVGTTSVRTLESVWQKYGEIRADSANTSIFIYPGYRFGAIDGLITNFHLPESTLIMLVSAFAGYDLTMSAYRHAVEERYRFFSFGDAMLIL